MTVKEICAQSLYVFGVCCMVAGAWVYLSKDTPTISDMLHFLPALAMFIAGFFLSSIDLSTFGWLGSLDPLVIAVAVIGVVFGVIGVIFILIGRQADGERVFNFAFGFVTFGTGLEIGSRRQAKSKAKQRISKNLRGQLPQTGEQS